MACWRGPVRRHSNLRRVSLMTLTSRSLRDGAVLRVAWWRRALFWLPFLRTGAIGVVTARRCTRIAALTANPGGCGLRRLCRADGMARATKMHARAHGSVRCAGATTLALPTVRCRNTSLLIGALNRALSFSSLPPFYRVTWRQTTSLARTRRAAETRQRHAARLRVGVRRR